MNLENLLSIALQWSKDNAINHIYGRVDEGNYIQVYCDKNNTSLSHFLEIQKKNKNNPLIISKSIFQPEDILIDLELELDDFKSNPKKKVISRLNKLEKYNGKIEFLVIQSIIGNTIYKYVEIAEWVNQIEEIKEEINEISNTDGLKTGKRVVSNFQKEGIGERKIKDIAEELAASENFIKIRNNYDKVKPKIAKILEEKGIHENDMNWSDNINIFKASNKVFEKKYLEVREQELITQIQQLKDEKLPKVAICSKLELTQTILNKYYYRD